MVKIVPLLQHTEFPRPVLLLLARGRLDCLVVCLRCLENFTQLDKFKKIYFISGVSDPDYRALAESFCARISSAVYVSYSPPSKAAENIAKANIFTKHSEDLFLSLEENFFVTPGWLEAILNVYFLNRRFGIPRLISPLVPISFNGFNILRPFLQERYPSQANMFKGVSLVKNWGFHRWIWEKIINEDLMEAYLASSPPLQILSGPRVEGSLAFDAGLLKDIFSSAKKYENILRATELDMDEITKILAISGQNTAIAARSVVHRFAYNDCEEYLRTHLNLEKVWMHLSGMMKNKNKPKSRAIVPLAPDFNDFSNCLDSANSTPFPFSLHLVDKNTH